MADVLGLPVQTVQVPESPALGAAILAGVAAGVYPDVPSASAALVRPGEALCPTRSAPPPTNPTTGCTKACILR